MPNDFNKDGLIDFFIGGGKKFFDRREIDDRNLYAELKEKGFHVSDYFKEDINSFKISGAEKLAYFTADEDPLPLAQGRDPLGAQVHLLGIPAD